MKPQQRLKGLDSLLFSAEKSELVRGKGRADISVRQQENSIACLWKLH